MPFGVGNSTMFSLWEGVVNCLETVFKNKDRSKKLHAFKCLVYKICCCLGKETNANSSYCAWNKWQEVVPTSWLMLLFYCHKLLVTCGNNGSLSLWVLCLPAGGLILEWVYPISRVFHAVPGILCVHHECYCSWGSSWDTSGLKAIALLGELNVASLSPCQEKLL